MAVHQDRLDVDDRCVPHFAVLGLAHERVPELLERRGRGERVDEIAARQSAAPVEREEVDAAGTRLPRALGR
jgi:hypothetical protein